MSASTLHITRTDINAEIGTYLGYGRNPDIWTEEQSVQVARIVERGESSFYGAYAWSFLRPVGLFEVTTDDYELPEDFGGFVEHELHYRRADNAWYPIQLTSVSEILKNRGLSQLESTSFPCLAATTWLPSNGSRAQRQALMVWPAPSAPLTVRGQYHSIPNAISSSTPYPLGNQLHSTTLQASAMAAAELERDGKPGTWAEVFDKNLQNSIRQEQQTGPKHLGSMRKSTRGYGNKHDHSNNFVTYNGGLYLGAD
jgi:hypothetical protein